MLEEVHHWKKLCKCAAWPTFYYCLCCLFVIRENPSAPYSLAFSPTMHSKDLTRIQNKLFCFCCELLLISVFCYSNKRVNNSFSNPVFTYSFSFNFFLCKLLNKGLEIFLLHQTAEHCSLSTFDNWSVCFKMLQFRKKICGENLVLLCHNCFYFNSQHILYRY